MRWAATLVGLLALSACGAEHGRPSGRPNILLLVIDCLRADHVGAYGYERPTTPTLDELADDGVLFERVYAQASWTRPSVPSYLTGLYPSEHGLTDFGRDPDHPTSLRLAPAVQTVAEAMRAAGYRTAMIGEQNQLAPRFGLDQGFEVYDHRARGDSRIVQRFERWLAAVHEETFFAYLHFLDVHWPYCPERLTAGIFGSGRSGVDFCGNWRWLRQRLQSGALVLDEAGLEDMVARYDEQLRDLDHEIGLLIRRLEKRGLWDSTLVVITADHGEEFFEHGQMGHGQSLHGELLHVPLIVRLPDGWPGERGRRIPALAELRNLPATLADLAGSPDLSRLPGTSLMPWILGRRHGQDVNPIAFAEGGDRVAARTRRWALLQERAGERAALYDLAVDPNEQRDVAAEHPHEVERLQVALTAWEAALTPVTAGAELELDEETRRGLEALGYLGD